MTSPNRNRGWLWFFTILAVLSAGWLAGSWAFKKYYWGRQLTRQRLDEARALWNKMRPADYDLTYAKEGSVKGKFDIVVRHGKVQNVTLDGRPITRDDRPLDPQFYPRYDMSGLFGDIERFLEIDARPGNPRTFTTARFDPSDGHLLGYTRKVLGTSEVISLKDIHLTLLPKQG